MRNRSAVSNRAVAWRTRVRSRIPGIELAFDGWWAVSAQVSRDDAPLSARRGRIEFGQILESTPSRSKPRYPCRDADAGSVPCYTTKAPANPSRLFYTPPNVSSGAVLRESLPTELSGFTLIFANSRRVLSPLSVYLSIGCPSSATMASSHS